VNVLFVVTEHDRYLDTARRMRDERAARVLEALTGAPPTLVHYTDRDVLRPDDAIVLSGSDAPWAEHEEDDLQQLRDFVAGCGRPVLGICAGMQLLAQATGGAVDHAVESERGFLPIDVLDGDGLLHGLPERVTVYQSHTDEITELPAAFRVLASSPESSIQAVAADSLGFWGTQFHPERATDEHPFGLVVLQNFLALARGR